MHTSINNIASNYLLFPPQLHLSPDDVLGVYRDPHSRYPRCPGDGDWTFCSDCSTLLQAQWHALRSQHHSCSRLLLHQGAEQNLGRSRQKGQQMGEQVRTSVDNKLVCPTAFESSFHLGPLSLEIRIILMLRSRLIRGKSNASVTEYLPSRCQLCAKAFSTTCAVQCQYVL